MLKILLEKKAIEDMAVFGLNEPKIVAKISRLLEDIAKTSFYWNWQA